MAMTVMTACGGDDDEPGYTDPDDPSSPAGVTYAGTAYQVMNYSEVNEPVELLLQNASATYYGVKYHPTSFMLSCENRSAEGKVNGTSDSEFTLPLSFPANICKAGVNFCTLTVRFNIPGVKDAQTDIPVTVNVIKGKPDARVQFSPYICGSYSIVLTDADGAKQIHNSNPVTVTPVFQSDNTVLVELGPKVKVPTVGTDQFGNTTEFKGEPYRVELSPVVDEKASNLKWAMSNAKFTYNGVTYADKLNFDYGWDEEGRSFTVTMSYDVKGTMDGIEITETVTRELTIVVMRKSR